MTLATGLISRRWRESRPSSSCVHTAPPPAGTVEAWAFAYIRTTALSEKLAPPLVPRAWEPVPVPRDIRAPGRPAFVRIGSRAAKSPSAEALAQPAHRARLLHAFMHHELQAAELCCWALLRFSHTDRAFRQGLARIAMDEARHARLYGDHLQTLGCAYGDFAVRDWFWQRIPSCESAPGFVALMGLGLEAANLEHARRFAGLFRQVGDETGAELQERIGREEIGHVRFARYWLERWLQTPLEFCQWQALLPAPLSPLLMRGKPLNVEARLQAGINPQFLRDLQAWQPDGSGS